MINLLAYTNTRSYVVPYFNDHHRASPVVLKTLFPSFIRAYRLTLDGNKFIFHKRTETNVNETKNMKNF